MSPTEAQLRAALREGEGDSVDAGVLIAKANRIRRERRHRINTGLGVAAAVALIGGLGSVLIGSSHEESGGGSSAGGAAAGSAALGPSHRSAASGAAGKGGIPVPGTPPSRAYRAQDAKRACPAAPVHLSVPGGGGLGKFGSTDPLFSGDVAAITACGYAPSGKHASIAIVGRRARVVADTLETAPSTHRFGHPCTTPAGAISTVELLPVDVRGHNLRPVVVTVGCPSKATNGTAVRYPATLPSAVMDVLRGRPH